MKKIFIVFISAFVFKAAIAQPKIDRSQKPKAGPAPVITITDPVMYNLPNGITVLVVENHTLPKVSASFKIDAGPIKEGNKAGVIALMGGMLEEGTTKQSKAAFDEAVDQIGADVNINASGGSASALTRYFGKAFMLMAEGLRYPSFPQESFDKLKGQAITGLKAGEKSAKVISGRVVPALSYGIDNPKGEFNTEATLNSITLDDVKKAYKQYVTPSRGYLTFIGDIKPAEAKALAEKYFGDWKGTQLQLPVLPLAKNPSVTEVDLVNVSNAVQSEITVTNLVSLQMKDPDYFAVLIANNILGGGADSRLFMNLREKHGFTYGSYSDISADRFQSMFKAEASVRTEKADSAVGEILKEIKNMRDTKVSSEELKNAKALYNGSFALGMENPARTANYASNILINNLPKDFYRTFLQKINAVTVEDVQRVAQKYFNVANTRIVVVGKTDAVADKFKQAGFVVKAYDNYAQPVTQSASPSVANVSGSAVVNNYIKAIGGKDALAKVTSVLEEMDMSVQGMTLNAVQKQMSPIKEILEVSMGGNVVMKQMFDGEKGYQQQMGQQKDMSADEVAEKKADQGIFPQLFYNESNKLEVKGTEKVNGKDAYKLAVTKKSKVVFEYYEIATGLLLKEEASSSEGGTEVLQAVTYDNYTKIGDILLPFTKTINVQAGANQQEIGFKVKSAKINEGVKAEDFK
ncbi:insulinase family protein [Chitinophagaceae bacterium LWZ2-11]